MRYDPSLVRPMRAELDSIGFQQPLSPQDADDFAARRAGSALGVASSVCGRAAGTV